MSFFADEQKSYLSRLFSPENLPNIRLLIAGVAGIVVAVRTMRVLIRQTVAMERSTGIVMDTEQGRVLTYWEKFIHLDSSRKGVYEGELSHYFNWACRNIGKREIALGKMWSRFIIIKRLTDVPAKPDYSALNEWTYQGEPLHPSPQNKPQTEWFSTPLESTAPYEEIERQHRSRECFLYAYGYAKHTDLWGRLHEARFGVVYDSQPTISFDLDGWVVAGPHESS